MKKIVLACLSLFVVGCPTPPDPTTNQGQNQNGNPPPGNQNTGKNPPPTQNNPSNQNQPKNKALVAEGELPPNRGEQPNVVRVLARPTTSYQYSQEGIKDIPHITLSGSINCAGSDCDTPMLLSVAIVTPPDKNDENPLSVPPVKTNDGSTDNTPSNPKFFVKDSDNDKGEKKGKDDNKGLPPPENEALSIGLPITLAKLSNPENFTVLIPKGEQPLALELILDSNKDGYPSKGEKFIIYEGIPTFSDDLVPNKNISNISFNFSSDVLKETLGGPRPTP